MNTGYRELDKNGAGLLDGVVNVILCDSPYGKTRFTAKVATEVLKQSGVVYYIDLDTSFTAYLQAGLLQIPDPENLLVYNPSRENMDELISRICSTPTKPRELIIFDSVATLYHIFAGEQRSSEINWRFGLYLGLLQNRLVQYGNTILVTSMVRAKEVGTSSWIQSYPGGRVLMSHGQAIYELKEGTGYLEAKILKYRVGSVEGRVMRLPL